MFEHVADAVSEALDLDVETLDDDELGDALVEVHRQQARLAAVSVRLVQAADARRVGAAEGCRSTSSWLVQRRRCSLTEARDDVSTARRLRTMPVTEAALAAGDISAAHAHRLASLNGPRTASAFADVIERVVFDGPSRVIDVGERRLFTGALRRAIEVRDRHCTGVGCDVPAERCQVDHIVRHTDGGATTQDNGRLLCPFHNRQRERDRATASPDPPRPFVVLPLAERQRHLEQLRARLRAEAS